VSALSRRKTSPVIGPASRGRHLRHVVAAISGCLAVAAVVLPGGSADAATSAPAWQVTVTSYPTVFAPGGRATGEHGPGYFVLAKNVSSEPTNGEAITIVDAVGTGAVPISEPGLEPEGRYGEDESLPLEIPCSAVGAVIACHTNAIVYPGHLIEVFVPVAVSGGQPSVHDEASAVGGGAIEATAAVDTPVSSVDAPFDFVDSNVGAYGLALNRDGTASDQAGAHPYQVSTGMNFNDFQPDEPGEPLRIPSGALKTISGELPQGMVLDPAAAPKCTEEQLEGEACPISAQIGTARVVFAIANGIPGVNFVPIFNMVPPPGSPASIAFNVEELAYIHLLGRVRSDGDYGLSADVSQIPAKVGILGTEITLWGNPSDPSHDASRGECVAQGGMPSGGGVGCAAPALSTPLLTQPSSCGGAPIVTLLRATSWDGLAAVRSYPSTDLAGKPIVIEGCDRLQFEPTITANPTSDGGESPSGLDFDLHQPQNQQLEGLATANLRDALVALPEGVALNPSAAGGLATCSEEQIGYQPADGKIRFSLVPQSCPEAAKVGTLEVSTPLLDHKLPGSIYVAKPFGNPFNSLLSIYLAVEDEETGIVAKLAGKVTADPTTGRLTASFEENPELPLEDIELHFFEGGRAVLTTPLTCGQHITESDLIPWSSPEGADAHPTASFQTNGSCSPSEGAAPKTTSFSAGTVSPLSGAYSPFVLRITRPDGSQHITGIETTLPEGLLGKLAGVAYCPETGIAQAISREKPEQGKLEQQSPSCPSSSEVGTVNVTAGSGPNPIPVSGHAYLAGTYKGAPLSLVVIVPAVAGPFDLGTVVDRVALNVGEYDARIHAVADPLPTIREGIPLDVRSIELKLDRPSFTVNPTSCEAMAVEGSVSTQAGQTQTLSNRFQVGECGRLGFKPQLQISLNGPTKRTGHPAVKAIVTYPKQGAYANISRAQVNLPHSEFLDQGNIGKACTKVILAQRACPAKSIYGKAKAWSPLLEKPLEGPVYLVGGYGYKLPALVAELDGQIRVLLVGKVDTGKNHGIRNTFEAVPDAPVSRFVLELKGGKKYGLLENSEDVCRKTQKAGVSFRAQNGRVRTFSVKIVNSCKGKKKRSGKKRSPGKK
jgi:hypothetical protein